VGVFVSFELSSSEMGGLLTIEVGVSVSFWVCLFTMGVFVSVLAEGAFLTFIALRLLLGQVYLPQNLR